jgi:hypothetical protein
LTRFYTRKRDVPTLKPGQYLDYRERRGYFVATKAKPQHDPTPPPAQVVPRVFAGKGVFTTSNASSANGLQADWVALQMDPEGDEAPVIHNNPGRIMYWQARPTHTIVAAANAKSIPYIAQAESQAELDVALQLDLKVPKALVGNPSSWTAAGMAEAERQGWALILEWYWQEQPSYSSPDAGGYRQLESVCFGVYPAESGPQKGRRVSVAEYRAVWKGSFSCWPAEAMTPADRAAFNAA